MEGLIPMLSTSTSNNSRIDANFPESPRLPMEFLSRSWSLPALQLSKSLPHSPPSLASKAAAGPCPTPTIPEETNGNSEESSLQEEDKQKLLTGNSFSFASSATSQLVLERILAQADVSPLTSGRPSCSEPILNGLSLNEMDSPNASPPRDVNYKLQYLNSGTPRPLLTGIRVCPKNGCGTIGAGGGKTVGRWLKERRERKKEEARVQNAQVHAAVSIAAVAAAVAAAAAATAASSGSGKDEQAAMTDVAIASAAMLVAAQCVEAAQSMGVEDDHLASVISSAVNVQSHGDIMTLTASAATALRGAATLKARTMKDSCSITAVLPIERGLGLKTDNGDSHNGELLAGDNFFSLCNERLLARGSDLLKRTRTGELHWKIVSVYINRLDQVVLKMKSKHVAGTITKKKKKILVDVCKNMPQWPERYFAEGGEKPCYFGLKTASHRVIEFECRNQQEYDAWTEGVSRLLSVAAKRKM